MQNGIGNLFMGFIRGWKLSLVIISFSSVIFIPKGSFIQSFWYGKKLILEDNHSIGGVLTVFIFISYGILSLVQASPSFQALYEARVAAYGIWQIIDQVDQFSCFA
ncbi:unnamed protein product, partial [Rotaria magnacalcarata]